MSDESTARFDPFLVGDTHNADPTSPIAYVRGFLNRRLRIVLMDGVRHVVGTFVALDGTGTLCVRNAIEIMEGNERKFGVVLIPLAHVQGMEVAE
jgi:small nuclear ribonucleoprotein (snRNP)-like protein